MYSFIWVSNLSMASVFISPFSDGATKIERCCKWSKWCDPHSRSLNPDHMFIFQVFMIVSPYMCTYVHAYVFSNKWECHYHMWLLLLLSRFSRVRLRATPWTAAGSTVPGILQARILEWVTISVSNAWKWKVKVKSLSRVRLFVTPWTAAHQAPPPMGFSRQEYWSGVPLPSLITCGESCYSKVKTLCYLIKLENIVLVFLVILLIIDFFSAYLLKSQGSFIRHMLDAKIQIWYYAHNNLIKTPEKSLISISALSEISLGMSQ